MILMTRPARYEESFRRALNGTDNRILPFPLLEVEPVGPQVLSTEGYDALIFTSRIAAGEAETRLTSKTLKCFAVGSGTAATLIDAGFKSVIDTGGTAERMAEFLNRARFTRGLYLSGEYVTADLAQLLPDRVDRLVVYKTTPATTLPDLVRNALQSGENWVAPFFSQRSYEAFEHALLQAGLPELSRTGHAVVISRKVGNESRLQWGAQTVSASPDAKGMFTAIKAAA